MIIDPNDPNQAEQMALRWANWRILYGIIFIASGLINIFVFAQFPNKLLIYSLSLALILFGIFSIVAGFHLKSRRKWALIFVALLPLIRVIILVVLALIVSIYAKIFYQTVFVGPIVDWILIATIPIVGIALSVKWFKGFISIINKFK